MHFQRDYSHSYLVNKKPILLHRVCKLTGRTIKNNKAKVSGLSWDFFWLLLIFLAARCHSRGLSRVAVRHQSCAIRKPMVPVKGFPHPAQSLELCFQRNAMGIPLFPNFSISRMFYRNCCRGQLLITELFLGPVWCCRLVWLVCFGWFGWFLASPAETLP